MRSDFSLYTLVWMYGSTGYGCQSYSWSAEQRKMFFFPLSPFARENLVSRHGFGRPVPRKPAHFPHSGRIWCLLAGFLPISATATIYLYRQPPPGQSQHYLGSRNCVPMTFTASSPLALGQYSSPQEGSSNGGCIFNHLHGPIF